MKSQWLKWITITILFYAMIQLIFLDLMILGILLSLVSFYVGYDWLKNHKLRKQIEAVIKSLKTYNLSENDQKIMISKNSEIATFIFEINQLIDKYEQLKIVSEIKAKNSKQLLSNLSHDIRTPLTSIIGYIDAIKDGVVSSDEEMDQFIDILAMKANNLKELTDQIFNVARIDADDIGLNFEHVDLNEFLRHTMIDFLPQIEKNQMTLVNELNDQAFIVYADRVGLTRIFQNIIKNTIQHGKDGKVIGMSSSMANDYYRVIIWDKGKGIPKEKQNLIFERLYKVDDARKLASSNSGLGMAIAKKLVEKHKGNIFVKSQENAFTEFYVELPILKEIL
jgi:signal transduction histidine kinase